MEKGGWRNCACQEASQFVICTYSLGDEMGCTSGTHERDGEYVSNLAHKDNFEYLGVDG
jgi:hypothetical protein